MPTVSIPIYYPRKKGDVQAYLANVKIQLGPPPTGADIAAKYALDAGKVARIAALLVDIPDHLNKSEQLHAQAQQQTDLANQKIREASLINHEFGAAMQKHASFDVADLEVMGYKVVSIPPDPNQAQPVIPEITALPDMIRIDWVKGAWFGVKVWGSYDGTTWTYLDRDDRSPYDDKRKNQTLNQPENRFYKFRHTDKDGNEIGLETIVQTLAAIY